MTEATWNVILGALIAAVAGFLTVFASSIIESKKWKQEKKLEHLRLQRSELVDVYLKMSKFIWSQTLLETGALPKETLLTMDISDMVTSRLLIPTKLLKLWADLLKGVKDSKFPDTEFLAWRKGVTEAIAEIDTKIEKLLK